MSAKPAFKHQNLTHQMGGCVDGSALLQISRMNIDRVFIGACAVSTGTGICGFDHADVTFKRTLINASRHSIVLATNEKFSVRAPHRIAEIQAI
jgi:DeoR/GlpR family transcriptional regulator of sugar metabolism